MKTLIIAVILICYGYCEEDEYNLEDKTKNKYVDLDELGDNITYTIQNPSGEISTLLENIFKYYEALEIMHKDIKKGVKEAMAAFQELKKQGGPPFLKLLPVDEKPLEMFYNWKTYDGIEFRGFLKYNEDEWADMNRFVEEKALATKR